jgi:hypothetical protein
VQEILAALHADARMTSPPRRPRDPRQIADQLEDRPSPNARRGELEFDDCMRMEFRMVNRVIAGHDFYEGVRADDHRQGSVAEMAAGDARRSVRCGRSRPILRRWAICKGAEAMNQGGRSDRFHRRRQHGRADGAQPAQGGARRYGVRSERPPRCALPVLGPEQKAATSRDAVDADIVSPCCRPASMCAASISTTAFSRGAERRAADRQFDHRHRFRPRRS